MRRYNKIRTYKTVILPVVLYGCEILSLTLREEYRVRVFENGVLRSVFGLKSDDVTGGWRKLRSEEDEFGRACSTNGKKRNACSIFVGKPEGKRPLGRPKRRWLDNIMDLREIGWGGIDWFDLAQERDGWRALVNRAMCLRVP
jgi:hypothetical protein